MALTDLQRPLMADILYGNHVVQKWGEPWDIDRFNDLMQGGYPLKETGERWEWRPAQRLRMMASVMEFDFPTWLTTDEIAALAGETIPDAHEVEVGAGRQGRLTHACNVTEIRGLPERYYRPFWEIHPVHRDPRHPGFERYARSLGLDVRHFVERSDGRTKAEYNIQHDYIQMPPYEMFFSAHDYYRTLAHEIIHWAAANTDLVRSILESGAADYARNELVSEFGAVFLLAEQDVSHVPHPRTVAYVREWRDKVSLTDEQVVDAAEDAARVTAWLCHEAPAWRAGDGETRRRTPLDGQNHGHSPAPPRGLTNAPTLAAAAAARRFVADALALERSIGGKDRDAWDREAARLLEAAGTIDLGITAVVAAIEASVALETSFAQPPPSAAAWLEAFRERTARIQRTRAMVRSAADMSAGRSRGPRF